MKFHKNFHLVALFATMFALDAQAVSVSKPQVCCAVSAWAAANGSAFAKPGSAVDAEAVSENGTNLYWVVRMSNGGAVIASPDTDLDLVVAVLEEFDGTFPPGHPLPSILKKDMRNRLSVIARGSSSVSPASGGAGFFTVSPQSVASQPAAADPSLPDDVRKSVEKSRAQWAKYGSTGGMRLQSVYSEESIAPYVRRVVDGFEKGGRFTHWNQSTNEYLNGKLCYNYYTPNNEVCGCVATAAAAIMQFFGNTTDVGEVGPAVEDLFCSLHGQTIEAKTIPGAIDWSCMANVANKEGFYSEVFLADESALELAGRITYNFGVLLGMSWASEGEGTESGSYVVNLDDALKAYGFSSARHVSFSEGVTGTAQYFKTVYAQNWAGAPVVLGISGESGGHAVVACGYARTADDEELCRVFMGWGGYGDAWYKFPDVSSFTIVDEAVTMIGYDASQNLDPASVNPDDIDINDLFNKFGTIPVCGKANVANAVLEFPGVTKSVGGEEGQSFTLTASVDSNGFFAVRIPADTKDLSVKHVDTGTTMTISPFNSKVLTGDGEDLSELESAMPAEMLFLVLNTAVKSTVATAREKALEDGKAVLMLSGGGSVRESMLVDYITYLDSTTDMSNRFVIVRTSISDVVNGDGDPSIGVFNPAEGSEQGRWWEENGRLSYDNFINAAESFGSTVYTFGPDNAEALTNSVDYVLETGYDKYLRLHSGITVEIRAVDASGAALSGISGADREYGVYADCWTNGENVVFSVPAVCTNEKFSIMYECVGWSTNGTDAAGSVVSGNEAVLTLFRSNIVDFAWIWNVKAYRVSASSNPKVEGVVTPAEAWVFPGDRVTLLADGSIYEGAWGLNAWTVTSAVSGEGSGEYPFENGRALSLTVNEPLAVVAVYRQGGNTSLNAEPKEYRIGISAVAASNAPPGGLSLDCQGALTNGVNATYDRYVSLAPLVSDITDSTGGVWTCVGYVSDGVTNSLPESGHIEIGGSPAALELVWDLKVPEAEELPPLEPIRIKGIERGADGKWTITVTPAQKGRWYWLYSSDDISALADDGGSWTASAVGDPQQATEDGEDIVFTVDGAGEGRFWRAKVTETAE